MIQEPEAARGMQAAGSQKIYRSLGRAGEFRSMGTSRRESQSQTQGTGRQRRRRKGSKKNKKGTGQSGRRNTKGPCREEDLQCKWRWGESNPAAGTEHCGRAVEYSRVVLRHVEVAGSWGRSTVARVANIRLGFSVRRWVWILGRVVRGLVEEEERPARLTLTLLRPQRNRERSKRYSTSTERRRGERGAQKKHRADPGLGGKSTHCSVM